MAVSCQRADYFRLWRRKSPTKARSSNHQGIDISAPTGTSIVAAAAGEVVIATYSSSAGNYVMISHGGGVYTVYMHASSLLVSQGQSVKRTDHREGRFDGILHRVSSPLRSPGERFLCESDEICEPVGTDRQKREPAVLNAGKYDL